MSELFFPSRQKRLIQGISVLDAIHYSVLATFLNWVLSRYDIRWGCWTCVNITEHSSLPIFCIATFFRLTYNQLLGSATLLIVHNQYLSMKKIWQSFSIFVGTRKFCVTCFEAEHTICVCVSILVPKCIFKFL